MEILWMNSDFNYKKSEFSEKITPILDLITDPNIKKLIEHFWKEDVSPYFALLHDLSESLVNKTISYQDASNKTISATNEVLYKGDLLEESINNIDIIAKLKSLFRIVGAPYGLASSAVRHALEKPGGYPGDYELLEFIYDNVPTSENFGYCADMTFLNDDYARAVRSRKDMMKRIFRHYFSENTKPSLSILNIACGASRDLRELFSDQTFTIQVPTRFTLIDKSQDALDFSKKQLTPPPPNTTFTYYCHSVYDYLKEPSRYNEILKGQDLIYSIGLADYIPAEALQEQTRFFYDLLNKDGRLIIAHKDSKNYHPLTADWWADWNFYLRNEDEVIDLFKNSGIKNYSISVEREKETNIIFFVDIRKK